MMEGKINKIAVIGTGVIGTGWIIRFLVHDKKVIAYDINKKQKSELIKEINRAWPHALKMFKKRKKKLKNLLLLIH